MNISGVFPFLYSFILLVSGFYAVPGQAVPVSSTVEWQPCYQENGPFECARVDVPLVHNAASGEESSGVSIAMIRLPATDPERRIGTLFFNPGGPGSSGVNFLLNAGASLYTDEVRARYDLVGFDPRGIGRSDALTCIGTPDPLSAVLVGLGHIQKGSPGSLEEIVTRWMYDLSFVTSCDERSGAIIDYMTTADVARDLDLLRQAVGDEQLNFVGYSYGSYLGVTYASLFPDKVGALVVDGVLDPIAWATGHDGEHVSTPVSTRLRSDAGAMATLGEFFRLCDEGSDCAFAGDSATRFAVLAENLRARPLAATSADGGNLELGYDLLIIVTRAMLNDPQAWPGFAQFLAAAEAQAPPVVIGNILSRLLPTGNGGVSLAGYSGVMCSDSNNPREFWAWPVAAWEAEARYGYFGPVLTWSSSTCAQWKGSGESRYAGPFDKQTANPVLVVSTLFDAATRYESAVTVANLLPNSRLLTVEGWGHTTLSISQCATETVSGYLVSGALPPEGAVCPPDFTPFDGSRSMASSSRPPMVIPTIEQEILRRMLR